MSLSQHIFTLLYGLVWTIALPFVFLSKRLRSGWRQRLGLDLPKHPYDIWIQAASGGEAYLAVEIVKSLCSTHPYTVLVTTTTTQGLDILRDQLQGNGITPEPAIRLCPLDHPVLVNRFMQQCVPKLVILLETEIWPSILLACVRKRCPVLLANGRLSTRSLAGYLPLRPLLAPMGPTAIMAVSSTDKQRFASLFGPENISVMPNIKFDRIVSQPAIPYVANSLSRFFKPGCKLIVLGSVRKEEELIVRDTITTMVADYPTTIIALVPRHMHRIHAWQTFLDRSGMTWILRSELTEHVKRGTIVLWDLFGELSSVYALAKNIFVGGSLAPLGGQNFLEPLAQGVSPVIGPSWKNFHWVGHEIIDKGLVRMVHSSDELARELGATSKPSREKIRKRTDTYINAHKGGTAMVCQRIFEMIQAQDQHPGTHAGNA